MYTIAETIVIGKIGSALVGNYNSKGTLFSPALAAPGSPVLIRMAADSLQWAVDGDNETAANLRLVANYIIWLCGPFAMIAAGMIGAGGSTTNIPSGATRPSRIDFVVSASSQFPTGSTGGSISNFIGYNVDFIRGGFSQSQITTELTYILWNRSTGVLFISSALAEGEIISIIPS